MKMLLICLIKATFFIFLFPFSTYGSNDITDIIHLQFSLNKEQRTVTVAVPIVPKKSINCPYGRIRTNTATGKNHTLDTNEVHHSKYGCQLKQPLSHNAQLESLQLSTGELDQLFQSNQTHYTATVDYLTKSLQITSIPKDDGASLAIQNVATNSGEISKPIELAIGNNTITIEVTTEDGTTSRLYTVTIHRQSADNFVEQAFLKASNAATGDLFGYKIALDGNTLAIGAPNQSGIAKGSGAIYIFTRYNGIWTEQAILKASNAAAGDFFGFSIALNGNTLAVGAYSQDDIAPNSGAVYIFTRKQGTWSEQVILKASNAASGDLFGNSVALNGNTLAVGAHLQNDTSEDSGAVYIFTRKKGRWTEQAMLKTNNAAAGDRFGFRVALHGNRLAVGAPFQSDIAKDSGAVYLFHRHKGTWTEQAMLKASNAAASDHFGISIGLDGNRLAIGAFWQDDIAPNSGAAYVFTYHKGVWQEQAFIKASNAAANDGFGFSVDIKGNTLAVGAHSQDDLAGNSGAIYLFNRHKGIWTEQNFLKASNAAESDSFGLDVALNGNTLAVGAYLQDDIAINSGAVYIFK